MHREGKQGGQDGTGTGPHLEIPGELVRQQLDLARAGVVEDELGLLRLLEQGREDSRDA